MIFFQLYKLPWEAKWIKSLLLNLRLGFFDRFRIFVFPRTKVWISRKGKLTFGPKGRLMMGLSYAHTNYSHSTLKIDEDAELIVHRLFNLRSGAFISVNKGARLELGSGGANRDVDITCFRDIRIGDHVFISKGVMIRDSDSHFIVGQEDKISEPIVIGNNVWIGMRVMILKGVTIGDGSVIAAGSVVTRDVPPNCIAAGIPARVVREGVTWKA